MKIWYSTELRKCLFLSFSVPVFVCPRPPRKIFLFLSAICIILDIHVRIRAYVILVLLINAIPIIRISHLDRVHQVRSTSVIYHSYTWICSIICTESNAAI